MRPFAFGAALIALLACRTEISLDQSRLGAKCTSSRECPDGTPCFDFTDVGLAEKRCSEHPCTSGILECPTGDACVNATSDPGQLSCQDD